MNRRRFLEAVVGVTAAGFLADRLARFPALRQLQADEPDSYVADPIILDGQHQVSNAIGRITRVENGVIDVQWWRDPCGVSPLEREMPGITQYGHAMTAMGDDTGRRMYGTR